MKPTTRKKKWTKIYIMGKCEREPKKMLWNFSFDQKCERKYDREWKRERERKKRHSKRKIHGETRNNSDLKKKTIKPVFPSRFYTRFYFLFIILIPNRPVFHSAICPLPLWHYCDGARACVHARQRRRRTKAKRREREKKQKISGNKTISFNSYTVRSYAV